MELNEPDYNKIFDCIEALRKSCLDTKESVINAWESRTSAITDALNEIYNKI